MFCMVSYLMTSWHPFHHREKTSCLYNTLSGILNPVELLYRLIAGLVSQQNATCSSYRGMNSFKVIAGVAPKWVITYVSRLYPDSFSDEAIMHQSRLLDHLVAGDMILALNPAHRSTWCTCRATFHHSWTMELLQKVRLRQQKMIAEARIHVERANAKLKDF